MISTIALDPSSLTLWIDMSLVSMSEAGQTMTAAVNAAALGDPGDVCDVVESVDAYPEFRARAINLATSVWHEKRHFLDFGLTNYGAFRTRQFLQIYVNATRLLHESKKRGAELVMPLDAALDPLRRRLLGIDDGTPYLRQIAQNVRDRKEYILDDRTPIRFNFGLAEVGGETQLEALAYRSQGWLCNLWFGSNGIADLDRDLPKPNSTRYSWAEKILFVANLAPVREVSKGRTYVDVRILEPLLYGALMARVWGQGTLDGFEPSGAPSVRLMLLVQHLSAKKLPVRDMTVPDLWSEVNESARIIWGRSIIEELREDYRREESFVSEVKKSEGFPIASKVCEDYHRLRGSLIELLEKDPQAVISPEGFGTDTLDRIDPFIVQACPDGRYEGIPAGCDNVLSYQDPDDHSELSKWFWAISPNPDRGTENRYRLSERGPWLTVMSSLAPLAKLMINGRAHRTMLGPEIIGAQKQFEAMGVRLRVDPLFAVPPEDNDISAYWYLTQKNSAVCDNCRQEILKPNGVLLSPWLFRRNSRIADRTARALGTGKRGLLKFWKDWSHWLVCAECADLFQQLASDQEQVAVSDGSYT
jgi:hypothetical protein